MIDIDVFDQEFKTRLLDRTNSVELEDFIKEFSRKKKRQPIKTKKQFLILEEGEQVPKPKPKKKIVLIE
jgi:predicted GIY-YIG superfamily endonuclease